MLNQRWNRLNKRGHVEYMLTHSRDQLNKWAYAEDESSPVSYLVKEAWNTLVR